MKIKHRVVSMLVIIGGSLTFSNQGCWTIGLDRDIKPTVFFRDDFVKHVLSTGKLSPDQINNISIRWNKKFSYDPWRNQMLVPILDQKKEPFVPQLDVWFFHIKHLEGRAYNRNTDLALYVPVAGLGLIAARRSIRTLIWSKKPSILKATRSGVIGAGLAYLAWKGIKKIHEYRADSYAIEDIGCEETFTEGIETMKVRPIIKNKNIPSMLFVYLPSWFNAYNRNPFDCLRKKRYEKALKELRMKKSNESM